MTAGGVRLRMRTPHSRVRVGQLVTYRLAVSNPTDLTARDVRVCDRLPAELGFVRSSLPRRLRAGRHCWDIARLGADGTTTLSVTARVLNGATGRVVNSATGSVRGATRAARAREAVQVVGGGSAGRPGGVTGEPPPVDHGGRRGGSRRGAHAGAGRRRRSPARACSPPPPPRGPPAPPRPASSPPPTPGRARARAAASRASPRSPDWSRHAQRLLVLDSDQR